MNQEPNEIWDKKYHFVICTTGGEGGFLIGPFPEQEDAELDAKASCSNDHLIIYGIPGDIRIDRLTSVTYLRHKYGQKVLNDLLDKREKHNKKLSSNYPWNSKTLKKEFG